jgi:hypothetical protein
VTTLTDSEPPFVLVRSIKWHLAELHSTSGVGGTLKIFYRAALQTSSSEISSPEIPKSEVVVFRV